MANAVKSNDAAKKGFSAQKAAFMEGFTMGAEIRKAAYTIQNFSDTGNSTSQIGQMQTKEAKIPKKLLEQAKGLAFLHVAKAGFMVTGRMGTGLVIAKLGDDSWSAPSAIATFGLGWGAQVGEQVTNYVLVSGLRVQ